MEAEEIHDNKKEIAELMDQVKKLEEENSELYENILKMGSKKQKKSLEYYVRLKNDLLNEEFKLNQQLSNMENENEQEKKAFSFKMNNLKKKLNEILSENKTLKSLVESHNKELKEKGETLNKRNVLLENDVDEKEIEKLEAKVNDLTNTLSEKELIVQEQKEKIDELQMKIDNLNEDMTAKINDIKFQYDNVYSASKQNEENFNKLYEDKTNNMKEDIQSNKYQLEKKLVHSKNLLNNIKNENGILNNLYEADSQIKENEISNLKDNYEKINNIYTEFSKLCGGNLEKLKNNIKQMKEIYMDRENEMENMSKVYVESMNNYGEAIQEAEKNKNLMNTDSDENKALIEKLKEKKSKLEQTVKQIKSIKPELAGENINNLKTKISNMNENITHLTEKQNEFSAKIKKVNDFSNSMIKNNKIINSLEENMKKYKKQKEDLENKLNKMEILEDKDIEELKNKLKTLEQEKKTKDENLSKYEKMFENVIESVNMQDEVRTDVLKRLNDQITNYKSQIDKLLESKDNMQAYYIEAVKKMKEKIELLTTENNELKNENQNIAQNKANQKDIIDSCNQEYLQFKEAFYSMSDIENMISEFNKSSEEIKNLRDNLLSDELLKTKEDIKIKNKEIKLFKDSMNEQPSPQGKAGAKTSIVASKNLAGTNANANANKKKKNNEIEDMLKNIKLKMKIYNNLVNKKTKEVNGLEKHIKLIKDYNNYSKKNGENQELLCEENKIMTDEIINDFSGLNQFEDELKNEIQFLEEKVKINEESHANNLQIINNNVNRQLNAIKDRENYIVKQSEQITYGLKKVANQKQNAVDVLKIENQQLKDRNYIINTRL